MRKNILRLLLLIALISVRMPETVCANDLTIDPSYSTYRCIPRKAAEIVDELMGMVPERIRERLAARGWKMYLVPDVHKRITGASVEQVYGGAYYAGVTYEEWKIIYLDDYYLWEDPKVMIHEIGHAVDTESGSISTSDTFRDIYAAEAGLFASVFQTNEHNVSSSKEYFAETFSRYILEPEKLEEICPVTYQFLKCIQ